jgi:hypothetical protein
MAPATNASPPRLHPLLRAAPPILLLLFPVLALSLAPACGNLNTAGSQADSALEDDGGYGGTFGTDASFADVPFSPVVEYHDDARIDAGVPAMISLPDTGVDAEDATFDSAPDAACAQPLGAGALAIDELMIESVAGTGDYGQWIEVMNTMGCAVNLLGLHGECANGAKVYSFDVTSDLWIPPNGTFLVADSSDPAVNHYLLGTLLVWFGEPGGVLRKEGATITLTVGGNLVDTITYPSLKLVVGTSVAFPSNCPLSQRSVWSNWQDSLASWFPGFYGTPNAPNDDVTCPE